MSAGLGFGLADVYLCAVESNTPPLYNAATCLSKENRSIRPIKINVILVHSVMGTTFTCMLRNSTKAQLLKPATTFRKYNKVVHYSMCRDKVKAIYVYSSQSFNKKLSPGPYTHAAGL